MGDWKVYAGFGIMLELCELLKINVNELLSGERIKEQADASDGILDRVSCRHCRTGHGVCGFIYRDARLAANHTYRIRSHDDIYGRVYRSWY